MEKKYQQPKTASLKFNKIDKLLKTGLKGKKEEEREYHHRLYRDSKNNKRI